jgi:hypothetical protein
MVRKLDTPASVRVRAAECITNHATRVIEIEDIEAHVAALEQAAGKRVEKLAARLCPTSDRSSTLEELCRLMWRQDKRGFRTLANADCPYLRVFVASFELEDAQRCVHARDRKQLPIWLDNASRLTDPNRRRDARTRSPACWAIEAIWRREAPESTPTTAPKCRREPYIFCASRPASCRVDPVTIGSA